MNYVGTISKTGRRGINVIQMCCVCWLNTHDPGNRAGSGNWSARGEKSLENVLQVIWNNNIKIIILAEWQPIVAEGHSFATVHNILFSIYFWSLIYNNS